MENNEIMLKSVQPTFKSKDLNTATTAIYDAYHKLNTTATETRKTVAIILARVERKQAYKADGFKSLEEYAEQIGLKKSNAHKLKDAGRLLDSKDETVRNFANATDYSKLAILSSAGEDAVKDAVTKGELKPEQTQDAIRAWKDKYNATTDKPKVVPTWHITGIEYGMGLHNTPFSNNIDTTIGIANPRDYAREYDNDMECAAVTFGATGNKVYIATKANGTSAMRYTATKVKTPKSNTKASKTLDPKAMSDEQLAAMIAEYKARHGDKSEE